MASADETGRSTDGVFSDMSKNDKSDERYQQSRLWLWITNEPLAVLASLPLLDGVYAGSVAGGVLRSPLSAIAFGCACFSGAGSLAAAATLSGNVASRLGVIARIYCVVLAGAVAGALTMPWIAPLLMPGFSTTVAPVVLVGVSYALWPKKKGEELEVNHLTADRSGIGTSWGKAFGQILNPQVALAAGIAFSALHAMTALQSGTLTPAGHIATRRELVNAGLAVGAAAAMTAAGAILAHAVTAHLRPSLLLRGGSVALVCIAARLLIGDPIPSYLPMVVLAATILFGIALGVTTKLSVPPTWIAPPAWPLPRAARLNGRGSPDRRGPERRPMSSRLRRRPRQQGTRRSRDRGGDPAPDVEH